MKNKTMKVIELFNDIANGKFTKGKIKYKNKTYLVNYPALCGIYEYGMGTSSNYDLYKLIDSFSLNNEVEIIEDKPKKIEKIKLDLEGNIINDDEINQHRITTNRKDKDIYIPKINWLIDKINHLLEKSDKE